MAGFADDASGFDVIYANNVDFSGNATPQAQVTANGQLLIGSSVAPNIRVNTLTAGTGINIANGNGSITISSSGIGLAWSDQSLNFNAASNNGYFIIANITATLPASPNNGDVIAFFVDGTFTITIRANVGQLIQFSTKNSSSNGTQSSTASGDSCILVFRSTDSKWCALSYTGAWNST